MKQFILILSCFHSVFLSSQIMWKINSDTVITYYYQGGDEFSDSELSKEKWSSSFGWARSIAANKEQQVYSEFQNHVLKDGNLFLTVEQKDTLAKLVDWMNPMDSIKNGNRFMGLNKRSFSYTSGLIQSKEKYLTGYFEIKFIAPGTKGLWPAFWLYGGDPNEEIDVMELKGERLNQIHIDTHCGGCDKVKNFIGQKKSFGGWIKLKGKLNNGYNVVAVEWEENYIKYFLNGKSIGISKVNFKEPKHVVANIAIPANDGPFHPGPDANIFQFDSLKIDYIRVWTRNQDKSRKNTLKTLTDSNYSPQSIPTTRISKLIYGKKSDHYADEIFVSLFETNQNTLKLYCNGLKESDTYTVKIMLGDLLVFEKQSNESELILPFSNKPGLKISVYYKNKTAESMLYTK